jgi:beta-glucanase (GH16 family)
MKKLTMKNNVRRFCIFCVLCVFFVTAAAYGQPKQQLITSGRVNTLGKFSFRYGRLDISARIPKTANGLWPALWLLGADYGTTPWPDCGEIDVLEMGHASGIQAGTQDKHFGAAAHWGPVMPDGSHPNYALFRTNTYALQHGAFHLFTLIWDSRRISMYLDLDKLPEEQRARAKPYFEIEITPELEPYFCKPYAIIMNLAAGGTYTGITGKENSGKLSALNPGNQFTAAMYVDYVRVYDEQGLLLFSDEFDGPRLDTAKWNVEVNDSGGGNQELQSYRRQNVRIDKDRASGKNCLVLSAKRE